MMDYYEILGVTRTASPEQIKRKYREMAKKYHPDANGNSQESEEKFKAINEAYSVLSSPRNKAEYDNSFYSDDSFYSSGKEGEYKKRNNYKRRGDFCNSYTFYYTNRSKRKHSKRTSKYPIFSVLKGAVQILCGGLLMLSFVGFFPVLGLYIAFLGVENIWHGLSALY